MAQIGVVEFWEAEQQGRRQYFLKTDATLFRIEPSRGRVLGLITEGALQFSHLLANTYTLTALLLLLRGQSLYHLNTAAVISPRQELFLICGAQRAGKSTLTTALGIAGWQAISDDGVLVQMDEQGGAQLQAFKRDFHIAAELLEKWEGLKNIFSLYNYFDRACINGLELFDAKNLADEYFNQVTGVIFPQITYQPHSHLTPLAPSEALQQLIGQSMFFPLWREHTKKQIQLLTTLIQKANFYTLFAGNDIWENPYRAAQILSH